MKLLALGFGLLLFGFGESPLLAEGTALNFSESAGSCKQSLVLREEAFGEGQENLVQQALPGLNKKARRISRKSRRHTLGKTRGSAAKTRGAVKKRGKGYEKASRKGFNKANKRSAPKKKAGCKA